MKFIYEINEQSPFDGSTLLLRQGQPSECYSTAINALLSSWPPDNDDSLHWPYDEYFSTMYHHLIHLASSCSQSHPCTKNKCGFCYLHEYLILALQGIVVGDPGEEHGWADEQ